MRSHRALHTSAAERIELVDEDDARRLRFGLREQIAHACRTDADEHLDELRSAQAEEWNLGLTGDGPRQERLAGSRRADEQHALRNAATERCVLPWIAQELDDLFQLLLGLVHAGHIREAHLHIVVCKDAMLAPRKRHHAAFGAADAAREVAPDDEDEDERKDPSENLGQPPADELAGVLHARRVEILEQLRVLDARRAEVLAAVGLARVGATDRLFADVDLGDLTRANCLLEIAVREPGARSARETTSVPARAATGRRGIPDRPPGAPVVRSVPLVSRTLVARIHSRGVRRFANSSSGSH